MSTLFTSYQHFIDLKKLGFENNHLVLLKEQAIDWLLQNLNEKKPTHNKIYYKTNGDSYILTKEGITWNVCDNKDEVIEELLEELKKQKP
jgi:hypothetical protein